VVAAVAQVQQVLEVVALEVQAAMVVIFLML
jgi:hypothetical protein